MTTSFNWAVLRTPRWIAASVVALSVALLFGTLGLWQLDRLEERRSRNATVESRSSEPTRTLEGLRGEYGDDRDTLRYRPALATGEYRPDDEFFSIGRVYGDVVGTLVATPLDLLDGSVLIVVRGIVPATTPGPPALGYEVPEGLVAVSGRLDDGEAPSRIGESDPPAGTLTSLSRLDLAYIDTWVDGDVLPFTLLLDTQRPKGPAGEPIPIPSEELTEGSHLGYAVQWFAFSIIALIGLGALLYRAVTTSSRDSDDAHGFAT